MTLEAWAPLAGRTAVVTGGASGIGAAIASTLAAAGALGAVLDLVPSKDPPPGWLTLEADVGDDESLSAAFALLARDLGSIGVLVAAAGVVPPWSDLASLDLSEWDAVHRVNARGVASTIVRALPELHEGASIVVIASLNAWKGDRNLISYTASKHAVLGLTRSVAFDLGRRGIRVNAIAPGPIATEAMLARMKDRHRMDGGSVDETLSAATLQTALGRIATVDDIAKAALFFATDLSSGVTGQLLPVDAGIS